MSWKDDGYLKLDCTEDDDNDEDGEVAQNKLLILVPKDLETGTSAARCVREKGVSESSTSWMVSLLRRLGIAERHCKVMESHRS